MHVQAVLHTSRQRRANEANPPILAPSQCKAVMASSPKLEDQKQCNSMLLDSEISSGQAAKIKVEPEMSVLPSCRLFVEPFWVWRPNGWADRDGGGTVRLARSEENFWCRSRVDRCHVARARGRQSWRVVQFFDSAAGNTRGAPGSEIAQNT